MAWCNSESVEFETLVWDASTFAKVCPSLTDASVRTCAPHAESTTPLCHMQAPPPPGRTHLEGIGRAHPRPLVARVQVPVLEHFTRHFDQPIPKERHNRTQAECIGQCDASHSQSATVTRCARCVEKARKSAAPDCHQAPVLCQPFRRVSSATQWRKLSTLHIHLLPPHHKAPEHKARPVAGRVGVDQRPAAPHSVTVLLATSGHRHRQIERAEKDDAKRAVVR